jgi:hypothetical protein
MPEVKPTPTGISKVWNYFKSSFQARPNADHGSGLTAFKEEWSAIPEADKAAIRSGIENGTETY